VYERACQAAWYFKRAKPRGKVLILDGNEDVQSKKALFMRAWNEDYRGVVRAGVITANVQWCEVDFLTFESVNVRNIHVLGDAIQIAPQMPKSGHMANQHGKATCSAERATLASR
jgi:sulfide dehydrogenase [flavocytochrome c] flavoprotein chain